MALKGNLRDFSIIQLLNLINLARKTGTLTIEGPGETIRLAFRQGKLANAQVGQEDNSLAAALHFRKKITAAQYRLLKSHASQMSDKELGLLLINAGYITQEDVIASLQDYILSIMRRLYAWAEGSFQFENDLLPPDERISVRIDLENVIIEGSRRAREWEQLKEEIPSLEMALKFNERPGANLRNVSLNVAEWRVVSYVNPKNSIKQIAKATKLNDLEIRRIVYSLLQAGLVEILRPDTLPVPVLTPALPPAKKEEQKSLINRLITRIRTI